MVDQHRLRVSPLVLGEASASSRRTAPGVSQLVSAQVSSTGVAIHTEERPSEIQYGSFALDEDREEAGR